MCAWAWVWASWPRWRCAIADGSNSDLLVRPLGHLFGQNVARVAFKRSAYLRNFVFKFAELLSDRLDRNLIAKAMTGHVNDYELKLTLLQNAPPSLRPSCPPWAPPSSP
jgi:hypothetical protein